MTLISIEKYMELSVRDNIGLGGSASQQRGNFDLNSVRAAASGSGTDELIRYMPSFYDTKLFFSMTDADFKPMQTASELPNFWNNPPPPKMPYLVRALTNNLYSTADYNGKRIIWGVDEPPKQDLYNYEITDNDVVKAPVQEPIHRVGISGGQWQKLALARAFMRIKEVDLLILDEPSSALDPQAEYEVFRSIMEHRKNKTTIFIVSLLIMLSNLQSHRFHTVRAANKILV